MEELKNLGIENWNGDDVFLIVEHSFDTNYHELALNYS